MEKLMPLGNLLDEENREKASATFRILSLSTAVLTCLAFSTMSSLIGLYRFSPDSWSYYELSLTILGEAPYQFSTLRSYSTDEISAAFPFGWPFVLSIAGIVLGQNPLNGPLINSFIAGITLFLSSRIWKDDGAKSRAALFAAMSLVTFPGYIAEVVSGRAVPLAIALAVFAAALLVRRMNFLAGMSLGLSALVRFDFLVFGLIAIVAFLLTTRRRFDPIKAFFGFALGASPWAVFSLLNFGSIWQSDNSWVVASSTPAFVLDWPASSGSTVLSDPSRWLSRILDNFADLLKTFSGAVVSYSGSLAILLILIGSFKIGDRTYLWNRFVLFGAIAATGLPFALTGYMDSRYFAAPILAMALLAINFSNTSILNAPPIVIAWMLAAFMSAIHVTSQIHQAFALDPILKTDVLTKAACVSLIDNQFDVPLVIHSKYGAVAFAVAPTTGREVIIVPTNFEQLDEHRRQQWREHIGVHRLVADEEISSCLTM